MSVAAPEAPTNTDGSSLEEDPPDSPPETARYRNLYIVLLVCGFILSSSFRRGNLQHRRAHRSRAAFQFTLFPGHWTDRLDRSRLSLIWLPWSSGSSACIPVASAIVLLGIQCIIAATGITIHALGRRPLGAQIGFFTACLPISVCHFPPGTSKWNKIEHRLFSFISSNWRGRATARLRNRRPSHCQDDDRERAASDLPIGPPQISNRPQSQQGRNEGHPSSTG